jgi:hypothetical protein
MEEQVCMVQYRNESGLRAEDKQQETTEPKRETHQL